VQSNFCNSRRVCGKLQGAFARPPFLFQPQERVREHDERDVMMPARPRPSLKVIQTQLLLQLLVILFHAPASTSGGP
jgi:hypothetical protein